MPNKKVYMWLCAGGILAIIAVIWAASIRFSISASIVDFKISKDKGVGALEDFQKSFKKQIDGLQEKFNAQTATSTATTSTEEKILNPKL